MLSHLCYFFDSLISYQWVYVRWRERSPRYQRINARSWIRVDTWNDASIDIWPRINDTDIDARIETSVSARICGQVAAWPCPFCVVKKDNFATAANDQCIIDAWNDHRFGRSRASIWNKAIRPEKDRQFRSDGWSITASKKHVFFWIPPCLNKNKWNPVPSWKF